MSGRVVLVADALFEEMLAAWNSQRSVSQVRIDYGRPDEHGYYTPTITQLDPGHDAAADGADETPAEVI